MTDQEAQALDFDLQDLLKLRENRMWKNHVLPELERRRQDHRSGMRDMKKPVTERCEHVTAHEVCEALLEFLDVQEKKMRAQLREYDKNAGIIRRSFDSTPP